MRPFTIRDIKCEKIITCDDGDLILQHCSGDRLFLNYGFNSINKKLDFNLIISKKNVKEIREKIRKDIY